MMKRLAVLSLAIVLLLSGCFPNNKQETLTQDKKGGKQKVDVSRQIQTEESYYRTVLPFKPSGSRGLVSDWVENRLDVDEFETGLMRMAQDEFDPKDYVFQEGQYLDKKTVQSWLQRKSDKYPEGLNPTINLDGKSVDQQLEEYKNNPAVVSYIMEQNYLKEKGDHLELSGVVIGIALNSVYNFQVKDEQGMLHFGSVKIDQKQMEEEGKRAAEEVVKRLREKSELKDVPIVVALYKEQAKDAIVPGNFFAKTKAGSGSTSVGGWDDVNEHYYLFPSKEATEFDPSTARTFNNLKAKISDYFPNYVGVIGRGFYEKDQLKRLTIEIPMQFYGKAEVIAFTQYVTGLVAGIDNYISVQVYISSIDRPEAVIVRDAGKNEPYVHIYN